MQNLIDLYKDYIKKGYKFDEWKGVIDCKSFWLTILANIIVIVCVGLAGTLLDGIFKIAHIYSLRTMTALLFGFATTIYYLGTILPNISLVVRRLKDTGKEWYFILLGLIPLAGGIILIVFCCMPTVIPGQPQMNNNINTQPQYQQPVQQQPVNNQNTDDINLDQQ